jgi:hypothetical protein
VLGVLPRGWMSLSAFGNLEFEGTGEATGEAAKNRRKK